MNVTRLESLCSSACDARNRVAVNGHTSGQVVYRKANATTCPRGADNVTVSATTRAGCRGADTGRVRPLTPSVNVKSGASVDPSSVPASGAGAHAPTTSAATQTYRTTYLIEPCASSIIVAHAAASSRRGVRRGRADLGVDLGRDQDRRDGRSAVRTRVLQRGRSCERAY